MKKTIALFLLLVFCLSLCACACEHEWQDATCVVPQVCSLCEETKGEALGHDWKEATCASAKTCTACGTTEGEPLEHTWSEATCAAAKTCTACGTTEGEPLEHTWSEWEVDIEASASMDGKLTRCCDSCQKTESKLYQLDSFIKENKFIFTPSEFREIFFDNFVDLGYSKFGGAQIKTKDGQVMVAIRDISYSNVGNIGFVVNKNSWRMASEETESGFDGVIMIISATEEFVANAMITFIMSCDPTITEYGARKVAASVLEEKTTYNGVTYTLSVTGNYYTMIAVANIK